MILNLKEVFLQEGSKKAFEYSFSMSDIDISGVYPFVSPIMVKGEALNRAGLVDVNFDVSFTYNRPCDRCFKDVSRELNYQFNHRLVVSLQGDDNDDYIEVRITLLMLIIVFRQILFLTYLLSSCVKRTARVFALSVVRT